MRGSLSIILVLSIFLLGACIDNEPTLTPRLMKVVNREFRKSRKEIQNEADSLCKKYKEEHLSGIVDSILNVRIKEDLERKVIIN